MVLFYPFIQLKIQYANFDVPLVDIFVLILLPYVILKKWKRFDWKKDVPGILVYGFWLVSAGLSLLNVPFDFLYSLKYFFRPLGFFYLMYVLVPWQIIRTPKRLEDLFRIFFFLGIFASVLGFYGYFTMSVSSFLERRITPVEIFGLFPLGTNHNQIAELLVAAFPFSLLFLFTEPQEKKRKIIFLGIIFMLAANLLTFSRSGWIALFIEILILACIQYRFALRKIFMYSFTTLLVFMPLLIFMFLFSQQSFVMSSTQARAFLLNIALDAFGDHPFIGNGPGTFIRIVQKNTFYTMEFGSGMEAHGFLQQIGAEQGTLGVMTFLLLIGFVLTKIWKAYRTYSQDPYWNYVLLSVFIASTGSVLFQLFQTSYYNSKLWVPLGVSLIAALLAEQYGQKNPIHYHTS